MKDERADERRILDNIQDNIHSQYGIKFPKHRLAEETAKQALAEQAAEELKREKKAAAAQAKLLKESAEEVEAAKAALEQARAAAGQ